jgi:hypothetical protein
VRFVQFSFQHPLSKSLMRDACVRLYRRSAKKVENALRPGREPLVVAQFEFLRALRGFPSAVYVETAGGGCPHIEHGEIQTAPLPLPNLPAARLHGNHSAGGEVLHPESLSLQGANPRQGRITPYLRFGLSPAI